MAHWRLGQTDKAKEWYDTSLAWSNANAAEAAELQDYFTEEAVLMMDHLDARLDDQSTDVTTLSQRAAAQLYKEQYDLAKADWLQVVQLEPKRLRQAFDAFRRAEQRTLHAIVRINFESAHPNGEGARRVIKVCLLRAGTVDISNLPGEMLAMALDQETAPDWVQPRAYAGPR